MADTWVYVLGKKGNNLFENTTILFYNKKSLLFPLHMSRLQKSLVCRTYGPTFSPIVALKEG